MTIFKIALILSLLVILIGCRPKKEDAADVGPGNLSSSEFVGPVLNSQNIEVKHNETVMIDLTASNHDLNFVYTLSQAPLYGTITGQLPQVFYKPSPGYVGVDRFYFTVMNAQGEWARATIGIKVLPNSKIIFVRNFNGDDSYNLNIYPGLPLKTAQKAVEWAKTFNPTKANPVVINLGPGSFGNVTLTADLNEHVSWTADSAVTAYVGTISSLGANGAANQDGSRGFDININAPSNINFGNLTSEGGNAGMAMTKNTNGGRPGQINIIKGNVSNIFSIPGHGQRLSDGNCVGQNAGQVTLEKDSTALSITANGYSCYDSGDGGNILLYGQVNGDVSALGGSSTVAGNGGTIYVFGKVVGNVYGYGSLGDTGGNGGLISINGTIVGDVDARGGAGTVYAGGKGGSVDVQPGAVVRDVSVKGGNGLEGGGMGGLVQVTHSTVRNINANGGASSSLGPVTATNSGGRGGEVALHGNAFVDGATVDGGDCYDTEAGDGGHIITHVAAVFNFSAISFNGGTCSPGTDVGDDGINDLM